MNICCAKCGHPDYRHHFTGCQDCDNCSRFHQPRDEQQERINALIVENGLLLAERDQLQDELDRLRNGDDMRKEALNIQLGR